jgi:uncharacterized protein YjbI with pentapeptide repeats
MTRYYFFILGLLFHVVGFAQSKLVDSISDEYHYLYIADSNILRQPYRMPKDSIVRLYGANKEKERSDNYYLKYLPGQKPLPFINDGFNLDSVFAGDLFKSILHSCVNNQGGNVVLKPIRRELSEDEQADRLLNTYNEYYADVNVTAPISVFNSMVHLNIGHDNVNRLLPVEKGKKMYGLKVNKLIFHCSFSLIRNNYLWFSLCNAVFKDSVSLSFNDNTTYFSLSRRNLVFPKIRFENLVFDSSFVVDHDDSFIDDFNPYSAYWPEYDTSDVKRISSEARVPYSFTNMAFTDIIFNADAIFQTKSFKGIIFKNCEFNGPFFLKDKILDTCQFQGCKFQRLIDLRNVSFERGTSLKGSFFKKYCNVLLSKDDAINKLSLDFPSFEKIFFIVDWGWSNSDLYVYWDNEQGAFKTRVFAPFFDTEDSVINPFDDFSEQDLETVRLKYQQLNEYLKSNYKSDDLLGSNQQKVSNWFFYQAKQYEQEYYKRHSRVKYFWLCFLETVVNFGYEGEMNFFGTCLLLIGIFCILFRVFYQREINDHLSKPRKTEQADNYFTSNEKPKRSRFVRVFSKVVSLDLFKSFYFSFIVFFSPKFPSSYFSFSRGFVRLIIFEWLLGIFFIVLFFVYIAGNYPIITKLLGI